MTMTPTELAASLAETTRALVDAIERLDRLADKVDAIAVRVAGIDLSQNRHELDPIAHRPARVR